MPLAYSYQRFSHPDQAKGDSLRRQRALRDAYLAHHKHWTLDDSLTLTDMGVSAFRGKNALVGNLGGFLAAIDSGRVKPGSAIVVESLDRISRQGIDEGYDVCKRILRAGVHIITLTPERDFGPDSIKGLTRGALELQIILERAAEESERKSERLRAAWQEKTAKAGDGNIMTTQLPAWVRVAGGKMELIEEKAEAVRTIVRLAADGYGTQRIVRRLVADGVPPLGQKPWGAAYVSKILRDRRAAGFYQPRGAGRKAEGEPVAGYFPACVSHEEWMAARAGARARRHNTGQPGAKINLFAKLVKDALGGESYFLTHRMRRSGHVTTGGRHYILQNLDSAQGRAKCRSVAYDVFEGAVLACLKEIDPAEVLGRPKAPDEVAVLEGEADFVRGKIAELQAGLLDGPVAAALPVLRQLEGRQRKLAEELDVARHRAANPAEHAWGECKDLLEALRVADDPDDCRLRLRAVLRRVVSEIRLLVVPRGLMRLMAVQVWFHGGSGHRDYLIVHRPPHHTFSGTRAGNWWAKSLPPDLATDLDLRNREHAAELAAALEAVDLDGVQ